MHTAQLALPVIHVDVYTAGLQGRVQVLQESLCGQDIRAFFFWRLDHQLRIKHSLFSYLLPGII